MQQQYQFDQNDESYDQVYIPSDHSSIQQNNYINNNYNHNPNNNNVLMQSQISNQGIMNNNFISENQQYQQQFQQQQQQQQQIKSSKKKKQVQQQEQLEDQENISQFQKSPHQQQQQQHVVKKVKKVRGVSVYVRLRPLNVGMEKQMNLNIPESIKNIEVNSNKKNLTVQCENEHQVRSFKFHKVFDDTASQLRMYHYTAEPLMDKFFSGYNCAILVYGQSGAGKTHTMLGEGYDNIYNINNSSKDQQGIVPRFLDNMFIRIFNEPDNDTTYDIRASYIEIYQEKIRDLLYPQSQNLSIYTEPNSGLMISNAIQEPITNSKDVLALIENGSKLRKMAKTNFNEHSSRSHAIVIVTMFIDNVKTGVKKAAQLYMADLAGSENVGRASLQQGGYTDEQVKEAGKINQSLLTLGNVIQALIDKKKYIPYRDSKLTRLLQNSFGGNSYTSLILTVSQDPQNHFQTMGTLQFGDRANKVINAPTSNSEMGDKQMRKMYEKACQKLIEQKDELKNFKKEVTHQKKLIREMYALMDPFSQQQLQLKFPNELMCVKNKKDQIKNPRGIFKLQGNIFGYLFTFLHPMDIVPLFQVCQLFSQRLKSEYLWKIQLDMLKVNNQEFDYGVEENLNSYFLFFQKISKDIFIAQKQNSIQSKKGGSLQLFNSSNSKQDVNKNVIQEEEEGEEIL